MERMGAQWHYAYQDQLEHIHSTPVPKADNRSAVLQAYSEMQYAFNSGGPPPGAGEGPENMLDGDGYVSGWQDSSRPPENKWL